MKEKLTRWLMGLDPKGPYRLFPLFLARLFFVIACFLAWCTSRAFSEPGLSNLSLLFFALSLIFRLPILRSPTPFRPFKFTWSAWRYYLMLPLGVLTFLGLILTGMAPWIGRFLWLHPLEVFTTPFLKHPAWGLVLSFLVLQFSVHVLWRQVLDFGIFIGKTRQNIFYVLLVLSAVLLAGNSFFVGVQP